ncbi:LuxR C-terminal-related transcriptional regulator [Streptomyces flavofungini]|uniref:LuxR C-terminal-related transcriptional regulator n=1 Tax=Streptomyces flavofungini TaxID=68200 RepID=UPI0025B15DEC|nr:helix-turn-helix transcriptional regulator [Streptomyces flavofungini]WJV47304.1 helix-turn-helix transcriptional regulator [Streptomyces flavofungini]
MQDVATQAAPTLRGGPQHTAGIRLTGPAPTGEPAARHHVPHEPVDVCEAGRALYLRALQERRVPAKAAAATPCLIDTGLLHPDPDDAGWLRPTPAAVALPRLLEDIEGRVARQRGRATRLAASFEPFLRLGADRAPAPAASPVTVLKGVPRIRLAVRQAMAAASEEILGIQPADSRPRLLPHNEPWRLAEFAERGGRVRVLSLPRTADDALPGLRQPGPARPTGREVRALDELPPCLLVFDRDVAFIPAVEDGSVAFELRSTALVSYLSTAFDILWRLATPLYRDENPPPPTQDVSDVQRAIAHLLTEGHTDAEVARHLDMNVRTVRLHVARLATLLGSRSRTQLGYLIGRSGLVEHHQ